MPPHPPRVIAFNTRYRYPPVGHCIYCSSTGAPGETLGEEHIIPLSFGGNLILPLASCRRCAKITGKTEDHCVKGLISTARPHLGIRGRQTKKTSLSRGPVYIEQPNRTETGSTLLHEHPGMLLMPVMPYPAALLGQSLPNVGDGPVSIRLAMRPMTPDIGERSATIMKKTGRRISITKGIGAIECYRLIAKIAHAFAVAELGSNTFTPFLKNLILGEQPMFADHFVGSAMVNDAASRHLHELNFAPAVDQIFSELIVVRVRLFASLDMPTHYAVVGQRPKNGFRQLTPPQPG
jgi:hypothetical protein